MAGFLCCGIIFNKISAVPFSIIADNVSNQTLAPDTEATLTVRFNPQAAGEFNSGFDIPFSDPDENPVTVSLSGRVLAVQFKVSASPNQNPGVPFALSITLARDASGAYLTGDHQVTVTSNLDGTVFNEEAVYTGGTATV